MVVPDVLPKDIDYEWYIKEAQRILVDIGAKEKAPTAAVQPDPAGAVPICQPAGETEYSSRAASLNA